MKRLFGQIDLTQGSIIKNLIFFSLPFFISNLLNSLYSAIDLMFIGQCCDTYNIAAVSSGTTIMFVVNSVILGLATGGTIVIGQYFGAKSNSTAKIIKYFTAYMTFVCILITSLMLISYNFIVDAMQLDPDTASLTKTYLICLITGIPFYTGYISVSAILRGLGNSFIPFVFFSVAIAFNIGLDALFVIGLNLKSFGAAIATSIGELFGFAIAILYIVFAKNKYEIHWGFKINSKVIGQFIKCGLPIAIQDGLVVASFAIILAAISVRGVNYTSAVGITDRVTSFGFVPLSAIASAISTATAQNMGAKKLENIPKYVKWGFVVSLTAGIILGGLCQIIPYQLASIFAGDNEEALKLAAPYVQSTSLDIFVCALVFPLNAVFIGSGHSLFAMGQNLSVTFIVRIPFALISALVFNLSLYEIGLCYAISTIFSFIACLIFYLSKKWCNLKSLSIRIEDEI